jgi:hypothetical protein
MFGDVSLCIKKGLNFDEILYFQMFHLHNFKIEFQNILRFVYVSHGVARQILTFLAFFFTN